MSGFLDQWIYTDVVKEHFINPKNIYKKEEDFQYNGFGEVGSLACGDQMRVVIQVEDDKIKDIRWLTYGCASAIASTSVMSEMVKGMSLEAAYHLTPAMITDELGGLPEHKFHCSVLGDKALRAAIDNYFSELGIENKFKHQVAKVICECKNVTDQQIEDLVKSEKATTLEELQAITHYGEGCGKCKEKVKHLFDELRHIYGFEH